MMVSLYQFLGGCFLFQITPEHAALCPGFDPGPIPISSPVLIPRVIVTKYHQLNHLNNLVLEVEVQDQGVGEVGSFQVRRGRICPRLFSWLLVVMVICGGPWFVRASS